MYNAVKAFSVKQGTTEGGGYKIVVCKEDSEMVIDTFVATTKKEAERKFEEAGYIFTCGRLV